MNEKSVRSNFEQKGIIIIEETFNESLSNERK